MLTLQPRIQQYRLDSEGIVSALQVRYKRAVACIYMYCVSDACGQTLTTPYTNPTSPKFMTLDSMISRRTFNVESIVPINIESTINRQSI